MVRLSDLPDFEAAHLLSKNMAPLGETPWVAPTRPLSERRFALITSAGIHTRDDAGFNLHDATYRLLPGELTGAELVMSHTSVNFDRTGFQEDVNLVFPIDRFRELEADGSIAGLANEHMSFMGAGLEPRAYETSVRTLARLLRDGGVDSAFLTPV